MEIPSRQRISPTQWETHREEIERLYSNEGWTRKQVEEHMWIRYRFYATKFQYEAQFKVWKLKKNPSKETWEHIRHLNLDTSTSSIAYNGRPINSKKLTRAIRRKRPGPVQTAVADHIENRQLQNTALNKANSCLVLSPSFRIARIPPARESFSELRPESTVDEFFRAQSVQLGESAAFSAQEHGRSLSGNSYGINWAPSKRSASGKTIEEILKSLHVSISTMFLDPLGGLWTPSEQQQIQCTTQADLAKFYFLLHIISNRLETVLHLHCAADVWFAFKETFVAVQRAVVNRVLSNPDERSMPLRLIHCAIAANDAVAVSELLELSGTHPNNLFCRVGYRCSLLGIELAASLHYREVVEVLHRMGADLNRTSIYTEAKFGVTSGGALFWAVRGAKDHESACSNNFTTNSAAQHRIISFLVSEGAHPDSAQSYAIRLREFIYGCSSNTNEAERILMVIEHKNSPEFAREVLLGLTGDGNLIDMHSRQQYFKDKIILQLVSAGTQGLQSQASLTGETVRIIIELLISAVRWHSSSSIRQLSIYGVSLETSTETCSCGLPVISCLDAQLLTAHEETMKDDSMLDGLQPLLEMNHEMEALRLIREIEAAYQRKEVGAPNLIMEDNWLVAALSNQNETLVRRLLHVRVSKLFYDAEILLAVLENVGHEMRFLKFLMVDNFHAFCGEDLVDVFGTADKLDLFELAASGNVVFQRNHLFAAVRSQECAVVKLVLDNCTTGPIESNAFAILLGPFCGDCDGGWDRAKREQIIDMLLNYNPRSSPVYCAYHFGRALVAAARVGDVDMSQRLLEHDMDVHALIPGNTDDDNDSDDDDGDNFHGRISLLARLIQKDESKDQSICQLVLEKHCEVGQLDRPAVWKNSRCDTPLGMAIKHGRFQLCVVLVEVYKADINFPLTKGQWATPLEHAVTSRHYDLVQWLINKGALVNRPGINWGIIASRVAARDGSCGILRLLMEAGADMSAGPSKSWPLCRTPLEEAADFGRLDTVRLLLSFGVRTTGDRASAFRRAIELAKDHGHLSVLRVLEKHAQQSECDSRLEGIPPTQSGSIIELTEGDFDELGGLETDGWDFSNFVGGDFWNASTGPYFFTSMEMELLDRSG